MEQNDADSHELIKSVGPGEEGKLTTDSIMTGWGTFFVTACH